MTEELLLSTHCAVFGRIPKCCDDEEVRTGQPVTVLARQTQKVAMLGCGRAHRERSFGSSMSSLRMGGGSTVLRSGLESPISSVVQDAENGHITLLLGSHDLCSLRLLDEYHSVGISVGEEVSQSGSKSLVLARQFKTKKRCGRTLVGAVAMGLQEAS